MNICITGASKGIGKALSEQLIARGHTVWGVSRSEDILRGMSQTLPATLWRASVVDVRDASAIARWADDVDHTNFQPDCIVLNASVQQNDLLDTYDHHAGDENLRVNLGGALACVGAFQPLFHKRGIGRFVAIASTVALRPSMRSASYAASKAGIVMAFRTLRLRYAPEGIRFSLAILGPIATEMWEGKTHWLVPAPKKAATALASFITSGGETLYYPFLSTAMLRCSRRLSDGLFAAISAKILKS
ncbi:hypothetical protein A3H90_00545 [Candidatus Peribacteria bacterium RIFCSPLOWO2_02_FULL_55_36]|nr:MAG: hypothetical protein A2789_01250 [Candidatus Peribacteria bacterium RIFCSPHIGHO2_01_FULL_54_22]OGJ63117.1 MAG: hypothetical protein A3D12_02755 [Candidatus Peribacteria bacterium RIFCSPHIGHO2_02_FULL_55_24]OGJ64030.1 MAG: hypothetical protein A3E47_02895 [Candidatus Peribacteria bacterium RIFCSPHIGHO2_12_FULL_54_10]OGJ70179.1 MAG: hypothetical protein A3H90_00545 [Candidatus Peribacteria bacterium RIFCSPLOWO2_02_FULL_55_36]